MHIPDGYLAPQTYVPAYAVALPFWAAASIKVKRKLATSRVPFLALGAAFCFVVMMFNVPVPGGTTGHAVGGVLLAVLLGPWEAVLAVSLVLLVQALIFGDGGVTTLGANCLSMAIAMPVSGWWIYRLISAGATPDSSRQWIGAAAGGYVGLNVAAFVTAFLLGIQPATAHDPAGLPLYCPFGLKATLPAMMSAHVLLGLVEAVATGLVFAYLRRTDPVLLNQSLQREPRDGKKLVARLRIAVLVLAVLTPIGFFLPSALRSGSAWGEWDSSEVATRTGHEPKGLKSLENTWHAPMPDYALPGKEGQTFSRASLSYVGSAVLGCLVVTSLVLAFRRRETAG